MKRLDANAPTMPLDLHAFSWRTMPSVCGAAIPLGRTGRNRRSQTSLVSGG